MDEIHCFQGSPHPIILKCYCFQLQRVKVEKQLVEKQRFEVEEKYKRLTRQTDEINKKLRDIQEAKEELAKENARLRQQVRDLVTGRVRWSDIISPKNF